MIHSARHRPTPIGKAATCAAGGLRVLLVDDDASGRRTLARFLSRCGFEIVAQADDGQAALDTLAAASAPTLDLIITDCEMPRLDGIGLLRALRARGDHTPVLMVSGRSDARTTRAALAAGATAFAAKPLSGSQLLRHITTALRPAVAA